MPSDRLQLLKDYAYADEEEFVVIVAGKKNTIPSVVAAMPNVERYKEIRSFSHFVTYRLSKN